MTRTEGHRRFTVVIPTRERCDTLVHALHTCVAQDYDNLEIVVSDNHSQDETREVVESYQDSRIRYVNTGKRVSMTDNFEFALEHVQPDGYVVVLGDDDGLLEHATSDLDAVVGETGAEVVRWEVVDYVWPSSTEPSGSLDLRSLKHRLEWRDAAAAIDSVISFEATYRTLPTLYVRSAVDYRVLARIKSASGRLYHSRTPDVYSGFAIAAVIDRFLNSTRPYSIGGRSDHSIGASCLNESATFNPGRKYLSEENLPFHPDLVFCLNEPVIVAECFLQTRDHVGFCGGPRLNMMTLLNTMMESASLRSGHVYHETVEAVLHMGELHGIDKAARDSVASHPRRGDRSRNSQRTFGSVGRSIAFLARLFAADLRCPGIRLECSRLGVNDVYEAAKLSSQIVRSQNTGVFGSHSLSWATANLVRRVEAGRRRK